MKSLLPLISSTFLISITADDEEENSLKQHLFYSHFYFLSSSHDCTIVFVNYSRKKKSLETLIRKIFLVQAELSYSFRNCGNGWQPKLELEGENYEF